MRNWQIAAYFQLRRIARTVALSGGEVRAAASPRWPPTASLCLAMPIATRSVGTRAARTLFGRMRARSPGAARVRLRARTSASFAARPS